QGKPAGSAGHAEGLQRRWRTQVPAHLVVAAARQADEPVLKEAASTPNEEKRQLQLAAPLRRLRLRTASQSNSQRERVGDVLAQDRDIHGGGKIDIGPRLARPAHVEDTHAARQLTYDLDVGDGGAGCERAWQ